MPGSSPAPAYTPELVDEVLYSVCVDWGFCLSPDDAERIRAIEDLTPVGFAEEVLRAETGNDVARWTPLIAERFQTFCDKQSA